MTLKFRHPLPLLAIVFAALLSAPSPRARAAQDSDVLMPEQSAAKARQIMQAAIDGLGGPAYLNVHDETCTGHLGQFDHAGQLTGYENFVTYSIPPFKQRTENLPQHNEINVFNGPQGWTLDRGGVSEESATQVAIFASDTAKNINNILRHEMNDPAMEIRYAGQDVVDLKQVDWVELVDPDNRTIRIAFDRATHWPIRETIDSRDEKTRVTTQEVEYFSLYHPFDGVLTPNQITRERNNMKVYQVFFDKCSYNTGLQDSLFTKESLDEHWAKMPGREKYHDKNKKNNSNSQTTPDTN